MQSWSMSHMSRSVIHIDCYSCVLFDSAQLNSFTHLLRSVTALIFTLIYYVSRWFMILPVYDSRVCHLTYSHLLFVAPLHSYLLLDFSGLWLGWYRSRCHIYEWEGLTSDLQGTWSFRIINLQPDVVWASSWLSGLRAVDWVCWAGLRGGVRYGECVRNLRSGWHQQLLKPHHGDQRDPWDRSGATHLYIGTTVWT